jgi:hypothetical protein
MHVWASMEIAIFSLPVSKNIRKNGHTSARPAYEDRFLATFYRIKRYLRRVFPF